MSSSKNELFTERFVVLDIDKEGKKFDRVSRFNAKSQSPRHLTLTLDYANELIQFAADQNILVTLVKSLDADEGLGMDMDDDAEGRKAKREMWRGGDEGLAEGYDYVMYGKVYKFDERKDVGTTAYLSFGGLLMALRGNYQYLSELVIGENVYLMIKHT